MERKSPFYPTGAFYKGNLHMHSVISDGKLTADQLKEAYKKQGYHFVVFSEHNVCSCYTDMNEANFITIQGFENEFSITGDEWRVYHLIAIPGPKELRARATKPLYAHMERIAIPKLEGIASVQRFIDDLRARGYMVMFNHPQWSVIEYDEILPLEGLFAVEVYNHCGEVIENMGRGDICWDALLRRGMQIWGTATDDNHNDYPLDAPLNDSFGGWVCVKARSLSEEDICQALYEGSFYASQGPEIYEFYLEGNTACVTCSPVNKMYIRGHARQVDVAMAAEGENGLTTLSYTLRGDETFLRAECIDASGKKAYSNPIFL